MPSTPSNGIQIEYEEFGSPDGRPLLLIMGLGAQMLLWDEEFCERLAERGHRVIRFDNRDVGLSTKLEEAGVPNLTLALMAAMTGKKIDAAYTLRDMANDAVGVLDALGIKAAHVVGASLGGMIAQTMAIEHPKRVLTLTSIMSTTGDRSLPPAKPEAMNALLSPPPQNREQSMDRAVRIFRVIGSPGFALDEERIRDVAGRSFDRAFAPTGVARQLVAVLASGSRKPALSSVRVPTLVIHGKEDPLVRLEAGIDTARAIEGAELMVIEGMGHDLPRDTWDRMIDAITRLTERRV